MRNNLTMTFHFLWSRLRNRWTGAAALLLSLLAILCVSASAAPLSIATRTRHFAVRCAPQDRELALSTARTAEEELKRIAKSLGYNLEPDKPIPLLVYGSHVAFIKAGQIEDRMTVGTARTGDEAISIDASGSLISIRQVLAHEITHAVIFRILGSNSYALPLWANEGIAKYESQGSTADDEAIIAESAFNGTIIPLTSLAIAFPSDRTALAYAEAWSAIDYLVREHGESAPKELLAELAKAPSFGHALSKVTGKSESDFIEDWTRHIEQRFSWARVLQIAGSFLWPVMAALAIIAFIIRRKRMREAARQWEWEEFEESMERQLREWPHR